MDLNASAAVLAEAAAALGGLHTVVYASGPHVRMRQMSEVTPSELAKQLAALRARALNCWHEVRPYVRDAMRPHAWGFVNGFSEELQTARKRATEAARIAGDADLVSDFESTVSDMRALAKDLKRRHQREEDEEEP